MDDYFNAFYDIVKETQESSGYVLPEDIESYIVMLLSHHIDKPNWMPDKSFAEVYLTLSETGSKRLTAKELGDACLFLTGVFPRYTLQRNNKKYYQDIGSSSYEVVHDLIPGSVFKQLSTHFIFLSDFIEYTVNNSKDDIYNIRNL
tara:strand:+ start:418 stop:855 length:438 start_codon:yes stop_codon:yes gene_type:complete